MTQNSFAEHVDVILILFSASVLVISWFLRSNYKNLTEKLDRMEACLNEVKKGYVRLKDCNVSRHECKIASKENTERVIRLLERVERGVSQNHSLIFHLCDKLVDKGALKGEDLSDLRTKKDQIEQ